MKFKEGESLDYKTFQSRKGMGDKEDPLYYEEIGLFSLFSTRWRHTGINLPSASEPEGKSSNRRDKPGTLDSY